MNEKENCCLTCGLRSICPHARHVFEAAMCGTDEQEFREFLLAAYRADVCEHWVPVHEAGAINKNA